jgi:hypothetical protein
MSVFKVRTAIAYVICQEGQVKQPNPGSALEAVDVCELAMW